MLILDEQLLNNIIIYWAPSKPDEDGERTKNNPIEIAGYWTGSRSRTQNVDSQLDNTTDTVYLSQEIVRGGWLWFSNAKLSDPSGTGLNEAPSSVPKKQRIVSVEFFHDIDDDETLWIARL